MLYRLHFLACAPSIIYHTNYTNTVQHVLAALIGTEFSTIDTNKCDQDI
jgi:hypothetical protein